MTAKSVIDIDINDTKFKEFTGLFEKYRAAVKQMPSEWAAIGTEIHGAASLFEGLIAGMLTQSQLSSTITKHEKTQETSTRNTAGYWRDMAKSSRSVAGSIVGITTSLLKWTGLTGVVSSLGAYLSYRGINSFASSISSGRQASAGVGATYGGYKAFGVNFGNIVEPGSFMSSVNEAMSDISKRSSLYNAGMTDREMQGDTSQVSAALLMHLKKFVDNANPATMMNEAHGTGLDQFMSLQEFNNLRAAKPSELTGSNENFNTDHANLNISREGQTAWTHLMQQFRRGGDEIEATFGEKLKKLAPDIEKLSIGFTKLVKTVADSDLFQRGIDALSHGLEWLGAQINDPSFKTGISEFLSNTGRLSQSIVKITDGFEALGNTWLFRNLHPDVPLSPAARRGVPLGQFGSEQKPERRPTSFNRGDIPDLGAIDTAQGYPAGLMNAIAQTESSMDPNAVGPRNKYGRAVGLFQINSPNWSRLGITDPLNPNQSAMGAVKLLNENFRAFEGDTEKAVAAYNSSPSTVSKAERMGGDQWRSFLPSETYQYMQKIAKSLNSSSGRVVIDVNNYTGGSAVVSTSQVAQGSAQ